MIRKLTALIAGLTLSFCAFSQQKLIISTPGSATTAPQAAAIINGNFGQLYGYFNGQLFVAASGDTSGATDLANLNAALTILASSARLPPSFSQFAPLERIIFGPGTFYFKSGNINILGPANTLKVQGIWFQGSGRGVTAIDYNPASPAAFFINNRGLDVKFTDMTVTDHDASSDFLWSQEQAGVTNVQDYTYNDIEWQGPWQYVFRLTGGNNNSEWKFNRDSVSGAVNSFVYVPIPITTTITSGSSVIAATNTTSQVQVGDTGSFSAAVAPLAANTSYYVVSASTSGFSVATTSGGSPVTFSANGTPTFNTGSDQFLNFWFSQFKFDTGAGLGQWINMGSGGSISIRDSDASARQPSAHSCLFNLLGTSHARGALNFEVDHLRIEHLNDNSCTMHSQWPFGNILFNNLDESSQAGNRTITDVQAFYEIVNTAGPIIEYRNSQLMGVHNYVNDSSNFRQQSDMLYENVTLLDNPTFANFITVTNNGNTGGYPRIHCHNCRNLQSSSVVGYKEIVDTDLNWNVSNGGITETKHASCVGGNSDFPTNGANIELRLPLNAMLTSIQYWNPGGSGAGGAYNYTFQTTEGTPTVLLTVSGANSSTPVAFSSAVATATTFNWVMNSDAKRTIQILDAAGRTGIMTGMYCQINYIG